MGPSCSCMGWRGRERSGDVNLYQRITEGFLKEVAFETRVPSSRDVERSLQAQGNTRAKTVCPPGIREGSQKAKRNNIVEWAGGLRGASQTPSQAGTDENRKKEEWRGQGSRQGFLWDPEPPARPSLLNSDGWQSQKRACCGRWQWRISPALTLNADSARNFWEKEQAPI